MDPNFNYDIEELDFLVGDDISKYRMMVRSLNWLVSHQKYDIQYTVWTLAPHIMIPRKGHIHAMC
eukprot:2913751-Ditylum_brightwellii.AAC.2